MIRGVVSLTMNHKLNDCPLRSFPGNGVIALHGGYETARNQKGFSSMIGDCFHTFLFAFNLITSSITRVLLPKIVIFISVAASNTI